MSYLSEVLADSPALYWRLGEPSGTTAADTSGNGRTGTLDNCNLGLAGAIAASGDTNTAAETIRTTNSQIYPAATYLPWGTSGVSTCEGWFWRTGFTSYDVLFGEVDQGDALILLHPAFGGSGEKIRFSMGGTSFDWTTWPGVGQWVHTVMVRDANADTVDLYFNGVHQTQATGQTGNPLGTTLSIGGSGYSDYGALRCDEVATYNYGLSAARILAHYNAGITPPVTPPLFPSVREKPRLSLHLDAQTPNGRHYRWGIDEPNPANVPSDISFSTTMPGGFDSLDVTLPRKSKVSYSDLERLSTIRVLGAGGAVRGEYRLERTPRTSGDEMSVSPGCVGWQAHLEDDKSASEVYVDCDLSGWGGMSTQRKLNVGANNRTEDGSVSADETSGAPSVETGTDAAWDSAKPPVVESWYDAGPGNRIGSVYYAWKKSGTVDNTDTNWTWLALGSTDDIQTASDITSNLRAAGPGTGTLSTTTATKRFAAVQLLYAGVSKTGSAHYSIFWTCLAVYGNHGLTKQGTASATQAQGLFASDVIANALGRWCPLLNFTTTGSDPSIQATGFVIPQLVFKDATTVADMIAQANRFELNDWAIWEGKRFYLNPRNARGRKWRARVAPSQLSETGPSLDRSWNGVVVSFQDPSGSTKTVGPTGSLADSTDAVLLDTDPSIPANQLGIKRYTLIDMGITSTVAGATEVGRRFLEQTKLLDTSGQAELVGTVVDDRGIERPASAVRAGDQISFVDSSSPEYRRIVKTSYSDASRTCSIDIDAPPEGMDALLERLGIVLVNLPSLPSAPPSLAITESAPPGSRPGFN